MPKQTAKRKSLAKVDAKAVEKKTKLEEEEVKVLKTKDSSAMEEEVQGVEDEVENEDEEDEGDEGNRKGAGDDGGEDEPTGDSSPTKDVKNTDKKEGSKDKGTKKSSKLPKKDPSSYVKLSTIPAADVPKKPLSAYFLFLQGMRAKAEEEKKADPSKKVLNGKEFAAFAGQVWRDLPAEDRKAFKDSAAMQKTDFEAQCNKLVRTCV